jgi:hypothetical protein
MKVQIIDFIFLATYNEVYYDSVVSYKKFSRWQLDSIFWKKKTLLGTNSYYQLLDLWSFQFSMGKPKQLVVTGVGQFFWNLHFVLW